MQKQHKHFVKIIVEPIFFSPTVNLSCGETNIMEAQKLGFWHSDGSPIWECAKHKSSYKKNKENNVYDILSFILLYYRFGLSCFMPSFNHNLLSSKHGNTAHVKI